MAKHSREQAYPPRALAGRFSLAGVEQTLAQMATLLQALAVEAGGGSTSRAAS